MLTSNENRKFGVDVDKLARITYGYISEGAKYEEITTDDWFDHEVQSLMDRYPEGNFDKDMLKATIRREIEALMELNLMS